MKKNYTTPNAEVVSVELETMIAVSNDTKKRIAPSSFEEDDDEEETNGFYRNLW